MTPKSRASFTASLGLATGEIPSTTWTVYLEVYDSTGLAGMDTVDVVIQYVTG